MHKEGNKLYEYCGPVYIFGDKVLDKWEAETWAPTKAKARRNLEHRYKLHCGFTSNKHVELDDRFLTLVR